MHERHQAWLLAADELAGLLRIERLAPCFGQADHLGAVAASHFADALGEVSVGEEREFLPGPGEVRDCGFHAGSARAGDRDVEMVRGGISVA